MKGTPYSGAFSARSSEFYGDMAAWVRASAEDNAGDVRRLKRNLRLARDEELTARQREMLHLRYEEAMSVTQIAGRLGVSKSTVTRTLARAQRRLYKCLRYGI
mgnify:CR=1 FL=1